MSDWLDDLIKNKVSKIESDATDQKHQARRSELIDNQLSDLWNHLRALIKQGVERANKTPEIVQQLGCSIYYEVPNESYFKLAKEIYPAVYVTVTNHDRYFLVERKIVTNGQSRHVENYDERLELDLDPNQRIYMRTEAQQPLHVQKAAAYILEYVLPS